MPRKVFNIIFGADKLRKLKFKALRRGVWFKALSRMDRALIDLTMKVCTKVRSFRLAKAVFSVIRKLEDSLESKILHAIKEFGIPLAYKLGSLAWKWGNASALSWAYDISFARFLAIMHVNGFRVLDLG